MQAIVQAHHSPPAASCQLDATATHLAKCLRGRLHNVKLAVREGGVVIRGTASSYYVKQLAQHAVMQRISLPIAANEIVVHNTNAPANRAARPVPGWRPSKHDSE